MMNQINKDEGYCCGVSEVKTICCISTENTQMLADAIEKTNMIFDKLFGNNDLKKDTDCQPKVNNLLEDVTRQGYGLQCLNIRLQTIIDQLGCL